MEKSLVNKYLDLIRDKDGYEAFEAYLFFNIAPVIERAQYIFSCYDRAKSHVLVRMINGNTKSLYSIRSSRI